MTTKDSADRPMTAKECRNKHLAFVWKFFAAVGLGVLGTLGIGATWNHEAKARLDAIEARQAEGSTRDAISDEHWKSIKEQLDKIERKLDRYVDPKVAGRKEN